MISLDRLFYVFKSGMNSETHLIGNSTANLCMFRVFEVGNKMEETFYILLKLFVSSMWNLPGKKNYREKEKSRCQKTHCISRLFDK